LLPPIRDIAGVIGARAIAQNVRCIVPAIPSEGASMVAFDKGLEGFFNSLVPSRLQETLNIRSATYIRARALSAMLVILTSIVAVSNVILITLHWLNHPELLVNDLVSLAALALLLVQTWFFYRFNNFWLSGMAFTNFYFLVIMGLLVVGGGYDSPGKSILLTCPMVSFLVGGRQDGIQNTVIVLLFGLALILLKYIDFQPPNIFINENPRIIFCVNWSITILVIMACITIYESGLQSRTHPR
jgi:hypothetical protein